MTAAVGEIRGRLDRVSSVTKTRVHVNGTDTELELWIGGKIGKLHLPVEVQLGTPSATYVLVYNERDKAGDPIEDTITVDADAAPIVLPSCPHQLKASSTNGAQIICRY
jgi:hypothetical protein